MDCFYPLLLRPFKGEKTTSLDLPRNHVIANHLSNVRYGAFLRSIPLERRVGDHVHCAARVANVIFKRLTTYYCVTKRSPHKGKLGAIPKEEKHPKAHTKRRNTYDTTMCVILCARGDHLPGPMFAVLLATSCRGYMSLHPKTSLGQGLQSKVQLT